MAEREAEAAAASYNYVTHKVKTEGMICESCYRVLDMNEKFAVVCTASLPYKNNCIECTDRKLLDQSDSTWVDDTTA